jgi:hypothetical protein
MAVRNVTLQEIRVICEKCGQEISYMEECPCKKSQTPSVINYVDVPDIVKIATKIRDCIQENYKSSIEVTLYKEKITFKGLRKKFGRIADKDYEILLNVDGLNELKELLKHLTEWKDIIQFGFKKFNISALKFLTSRRYRDKYYDFTFNDWTVKAGINWRYWGGLLIGSIGYLIMIIDRLGQLSAH